MIRLTLAQDRNTIISLANSLEMFEPNDLEILEGLLDEYLSHGHDKDGDEFWLTIDENGTIGVAYCAPERMTNGTWNLRFIAIQPEHQRQGWGTALMTTVEQTVSDRGGRLLLVETAALPEFERTQAFYRQRGYTQDAIIHDFYDEGLHKLVYCKKLTV